MRLYFFIFLFFELTSCQAQNLAKNSLFSCKTELCQIDTNYQVYPVKGIVLGWSRDYYYSNLLYKNNILMGNLKPISEATHTLILNFYTLDTLTKSILFQEKSDSLGNFKIKVSSNKLSSFRICLSMIFYIIITQIVFFLKI